MGGKGKGSREWEKKLGRPLTLLLSSAGEEGASQKEKKGGDSGRSTLLDMPCGKSGGKKRGKRRESLLNQGDDFGVAALLRDWTELRKEKRRGCEERGGGRDRTRPPEVVSRLLPGGLLRRPQGDRRERKEMKGEGKKRKKAKN